MTAALWLPRPAAADGGELALQALGEVEFASLQQAKVQSVGQRSLRLLVPRFGASVEYGLSNRWAVGLAGRASLARFGKLAYVQYGQRRNNTLGSSTRDVLLTAHIGFVAYDGDVLFLRLQVEGGGMLRRWHNRAIYTSQQQIFADAHVAEWTPTGYLRLALELRWRPLSHWLLAIAPYAAHSWPQDWYLGAMASMAFAFGAGASF